MLGVDGPDDPPATPSDDCLFERTAVLCSLFGFCAIAWAKTFAAVLMNWADGRRSVMKCET